MLLTKDIFVPDSTVVETALRRTTHLAIAAHPDDIELIGMQGICRCVGDANEWFTGAVVTDGAGAPRSGSFADFSDAKLASVRRDEQIRAAETGGYSAVVQFGLQSEKATDGINKALVEDLKSLFTATGSSTVYLHSPLDRHQTHVGICLHAIEALRALPPAGRPKTIVGVEVWRGLDWLSDKDKTRLDIDDGAAMATKLLPIFRSQIDGGKRYDKAIVGRYLANATFDTSHLVDDASALSFAIDLMPLVEDPELSYSTFVKSFIDRFADEAGAAVSVYDGKVQCV